MNLDMAAWIVSIPIIIHALLTMRLMLARPEDRNGFTVLLSFVFSFIVFATSIWYVFYTQQYVFLGTGAIIFLLGFAFMEAGKNESNKS